MKKKVLFFGLIINMLSVGTFMMLMPLAPDFSLYLSMDARWIGYIAGGTTIASALGGFVLAPYLDRYNRKRVILFFLAVRSLLIVTCGLSNNYHQLALLFILSGCFAGPISGVIMAAVVDVTALKERGKAVAFVASGFSLAAIFMVPFALELAYWLSWQMVFWSFGFLGLIIALGMYFYFPDLTEHLGGILSSPESTVSKSASVMSKEVKRESNTDISGEIAIHSLTKQSTFWLALSMVGISFFGHFLLVPQLSNYFQFNLEFPREEISRLYLIGGVASIFAMHLCGRYFDKGAILESVTFLSIALTCVIILSFIYPISLSLYWCFAAFMALSSARTAAISALISRFPKPNQRAQFMSYQSTLGNLASGGASAIAALYLTQDIYGKLVGIESLAIVASVCTLIIPLIAVLFVRRFSRASFAISTS